MLSELSSWLRRKSKSEPVVANPQQSHKPYQKPSPRKLTLEQAKLKIMGHAVMGNQGAKELLEIMFR